MVRKCILMDDKVELYQISKLIEKLNESEEKSDSETKGCSLEIEKVIRNSFAYKQAKEKINKVGKGAQAEIFTSDADANDYFVRFYNYIEVMEGSMTILEKGCPDGRWHLETKKIASEFHNEFFGFEIERWTIEKEEGFLAFFDEEQVDTYFEERDPYDYKKNYGFS